MCGIAGIFTTKNTLPLSAESDLRGICKSLYRRGPDAGNIWHSSDHKVLFGHQRLSIIDLHPSGNQPMIDDESGCVLVFNGEIYNYRSLREDLVKAGCTFKSQSDSEVLLKGYLYWGADVLGKLRGMFSFAVWDSRNNEIFLARDPYGIKPLYYMFHKDLFYFSSQVKALITNLNIDFKPNITGVVGFLLQGSVPEPHTFYQEIKSLKAGHYMRVFKSGRFQLETYASVANEWCLASDNPERISEGELFERVRSSVVDSVRAHQVADVPVGAFLSSGIDSSALVATMAENSSESIHTMTLGFRSFKETQFDETVLAQSIATVSRTQHTTIWIDDSDAENMFSEMLSDMDQPSIDGFNTWLVSKHMSALGVKAVVSGVGGDELFGGYSLFRTLPEWHRRLKLISNIPGGLIALSKLIDLSVGFGLMNRKAQAVASFASDLSSLYFIKRGLFMPHELSHLLTPEITQEGLVSATEVLRSLTGPLSQSTGNDYATIAALESCNYLRNQLLRDSDWASMAHSMELRTPLVDFDLLKELAPLLVDRSPEMAGKKCLFSVPRKQLPIELVNRPKTGFSMPMDRWVEHSGVLSEWRGNRFLSDGNAPWARRMAYSLVAKYWPELVT